MSAAEMKPNYDHQVAEWFRREPVHDPIRPWDELLRAARRYIASTPCDPEGGPETDQKAADRLVRDIGRALKSGGDGDRLHAALRRIAEEPCDHGPGFCPREVAASALSEEVACSERDRLRREGRMISMHQLKYRLAARMTREVSKILSEMDPRNWPEGIGPNADTISSWRDGLLNYFDSMADLSRCPPEPNAPGWKRCGRDPNDTSGQHWVFGSIQEAAARRDELEAMNPNAEWRVREVEHGCAVVEYRIWPPMTQDEAHHAVTGE